jgi:hypothetical protein
MLNKLFSFFTHFSWWLKDFAATTRQMIPLHEDELTALLREVNALCLLNTR